MIPEENPGIMKLKVFNRVMIPDGNPGIMKQTGLHSQTLFQTWISNPDLNGKHLGSNNEHSKSRLFWSYAPGIIFEPKICFIFGGEKGE